VTAVFSASSATVREVEEKTRYAGEWIIELQRESVVETGELDGELVVRLRSDAPVFEMALAMN
jgi:hypothetical protein